jgi:ankyrin repeat protein
MLAVKRQSGDLGKILMMHNANPNPENESNQTPFHEALEGGHDEIIQILVENKADVNIRDKDGNTALHLAVKRQSGDLGKILNSCSLSQLFLDILY